MAIRDFGESLLADVRKRKEEQRKRDEGGTLGKVTRGLETIKGVAEIGQSLGFFGGTRSDQINAFAQNKDVLDTNIKISQAENHVKQYDELKENINAFNGTDLEYFIDKSLEETVKKELQKPLNIKRATGSEDSRANFITSYKNNLRSTQKIQDMAAEALKHYEDFGKVREEFRNTGTTEKALEMAKAKLPSTLKALTNIFTGTEVTEEAVNTYTSSLRSQGASKVLMFKEIFKESGGDFTSAVEIADSIGLVKQVDESLETRIKQSKVTGDNIITYEEIKNADGSTSIVANSVKVESVLSQQAQVAQRLADYNPMEAAQSSLNQNGIAALKERGFVFGQPKDTEAYENQVDILNNVLNETDKDGNNIYMVPVLSDTEKARRLAENQIRVNISGTTAYKEASLALINATLASQDLKEKIVSDPANSGLTEKEINVKLKENAEYKRFLDQAAISQSLINGLIEQGEQLLNKKFPESIVPDIDNADTASNPFETSTNEIITTGDSLGARTNNLLNVRPTANKNDPWLGQTGVSDGYAEFENKDWGIRAGDMVLTTYGEKHKINTIEGVVERFAPAADNNDTEAYINLVSDKTGFERDEEIDLSDSSVRDMLLSAMIKQETGEDVSRDQVRAAVIRANETEGEVIVTADQVAEAVANQPTRTLLGIPVARGSKSLQSIRKQLEQTDFKLTEDDLPSQKRKSLLEKREKIQEEFDRYEKAELLKNPDYSKTPSKAYALRMLKEDRRTLSEEDAIANYVKRMKGEMK